MDRTTWDRYTSPRASWEYDIIAPGYKFNLPDVLAAIGVCQLDRAWLFYEQRKAIVDMYNKAFETLDFIELPPDGPGNSWHLYLMRIIPEFLFTLFRFSILLTGASFTPTLLLKIIRMQKINITEQFQFHSIPT